MIEARYGHALKQTCLFFHTPSRARSSGTCRATLAALAGAKQLSEFALSNERSFSLVETLLKDSGDRIDFCTTISKLQNFQAELHIRLPSIHEVGLCTGRGVNSSYPAYIYIYTRGQKSHCLPREDDKLVVVAIRGQVGRGRNCPHSHSFFPSCLFGWW